ncbi:MAG TPA: hypothetical protein VE172_22045 [Stackebrandtia sp.]|jgi:hypothetical protein|uniref:hypothetical protein n=1 Tax=Stackebrandtia sp. TaxID=2023065 RepID=UPI002D2EAD7D|nr:hypothetical protein [Stackebrandtia sp.]HZE41491.1 hypothetical protein [Stackebrandtia sp.]
MTSTPAPDKHGMLEALTARVVDGEGRASRTARRAAFDNTETTEPSRTLIGKVARHPTTVADHDITAARDAGLSEDQIFELVVCAAVGQSARQYQAALSALSATDDEG